MPLSSHFWRFQHFSPSGHPWMCHRLYFCSSFICKSMKSQICWKNLYLKYSCFCFFWRHLGDISFQCSDAVGWATGKASGRFWPVKEDGCWFVGGDSLIGALHASYLQLLPPLPSTLAPRKSRMVTFWYWLTHVHLENIHVKTERKTEVTACLVACAFSCSLQATY